MNKINELIINNLDIANKIARERYKKIPKCVSFEEIQSAAYLGLVKAANKFDFKRSFQKYSSYRIYGEIKDYLRSLFIIKRCKKVELNDFEEIKKEIQEIEFEEIIKYLDEQDRKILILKYKNNCTITQIGCIISMSKSKVHKKLHQIYSFLKSKIYG